MTKKIFLFIRFNLIWKNILFSLRNMFMQYLIMKSDSDIPSESSKHSQVPHMFY